MSNIVHAAIVEPRRPLAAAFKHVAELWRDSAPGVSINLSELSEREIRDLGLDAEQHGAAVAPRLWSDWFNAPRAPFSL